MYKKATILMMLLSVMISACGQADSPPPRMIGPPVYKDGSAPPSDNTIACQEDAMQCPDGSFVGRSGPNCEFICPSTKP